MKNPTKQYYFDSAGQKKIYVQEWGQVGKPAILFIHGFPGSSDHAQLMTTSPLHESFRIIAIDRPGYGKSDRQKAVTPLGLALQLQDLLNYLCIEKVHIMHVSGGAPYGLALAYLLKNRVVRVSSICGIAPVTRKNFSYLNSSQKKNWFTQKLVPAKVLDMVLHRVFKRDVKELDRMVFGNMESFPSADQKVFSHPTIGPFLADSIYVSLSQGPGALVDDLAVYSRPWGFPIEAISCPITLWHGDADDVVHVRIAEQMRSYMQTSLLRMTPNEGHYSVALNYREEILQDLLAPC
jgi:pimeloyl-ACP methyl ester carboxylesterase